LGKIKKICVVTDKYPTDMNPINTFVDQLVTEFSEQDLECIVIAPHSLTRNLMRRDNEVPPRIRFKNTESGNTIRIYAPRYFSYSNNILGFNTAIMSFCSFKRAAMREHKKYLFNVDAYYGHFISPSGLTAYELGMKYHKPFYIAYGESSIDIFKNIDRSYVVKALRGVNGVIAVSSANKTELLENGIIRDNEENKIGVFPNGINRNRFYVIDKQEVREELGFHKEAFIVAFVGDFIKRKGIEVLSSALENLKNVYSIFIGKGNLQPTCSNILFKGPQKHDQVFRYLNAADVFVLPTLSEGCCNAIIEAMACGLPVISSNESFNDDILDNTCSIRIDPKNVSDITNAINLLLFDIDLRSRLADGAVKKAQTLDIKRRAKNIITFMESRI
jgi:glycosyltransferase involved in cell wall biosynthesis